METIPGFKSLKKSKGILKGMALTKVPYFLQKAYKGSSKVKKKVEQYVKEEGNIQKLKDFMGDPLTNVSQNLLGPKLSKGGSISFDPMDYYSGGYLKYVKGGVTPGKFSHKENPLTVVDKQGNDTGMELTGGEGVFDQKAMTMLDKYKKNKNYSKAGKLVFNEMDSWVDAGTAKYGTRIKYK